MSLFVTRFWAAGCLTLASLLGNCTVQADAPVDARMFYLQNGEPVQRGIGLGDPSNWNVMITGRSGKSAGGKVEVNPTDYKSKDDALQVKWSKKTEQGNFSMYGAPINLTPYVQAASLVITMRVDVPPDKPVSIGMDCGYPCGATIGLNPLIKSMPKGKWFELPIPLNCFKGDNFDMSKINAPVVISTQGKFTVSLLNIHLEKRAPDEVGCN